MTKKIQQNLIVLAIGFIALSFIYYKYLITPLQLKYRDSASKLQQVEQKLEEMKMRAMELPKLQAEMKVLELEVAGLEKLLPKEKEIPELLRMVTKTAQKYQLKISNFSPNPIASLSNYNEIPFKITLQGTYHSFAQFLAELGQEPRILSARDIVINANQPSKENPATINVNFLLVAYTFKS